MPTVSDAVMHLAASRKLTSPLARPGPQNEFSIAQDDLRSKEIRFLRHRCRAWAGANTLRIFGPFGQRQRRWRHRILTGRHEGERGSNPGTVPGSGAEHRLAVGTCSVTAPPLPPPQLHADREHGVGGGKTGSAGNHPNMGIILGGVHAARTKDRAVPAGLLEAHVSVRTDRVPECCRCSSGHRSEQENGRVPV